MIRISSTFGHKIRVRRKKHGIDHLSKVADDLSEKFNLSSATTLHHLKCIEQGKFYGRGTLEGKSVATMVEGDLGEQRLRELAIYLRALGYSENDSLIAQFRQGDERFDYPPNIEVPLLQGEIQNNNKRDENKSPYKRRFSN